MRRRHVRGVKTDLGDLGYVVTWLLDGYFPRWAAHPVGAGSKWRCFSERDAIAYVREHARPPSRPRASAEDLHRLRIEAGRTSDGDLRRLVELALEGDTTALEECAHLAGVQP